MTSIIITKKEFAELLRLTAQYVAENNFSGCCAAFCAVAGHAYLLQHTKADVIVCVFDELMRHYAPTYKEAFGSSSSEASEALGYGLPDSTVLSLGRLWWRPYYACAPDEAVRISAERQLFLLFLAEAIESEEGEYILITPK